MQKTSDVKIKTQERRKIVLKMRKEGYHYEEILAEVKKQIPEEYLPKNYDLRQCYQDVKRELDKLEKEVSETALEVRSIEMQRLEKLFNSHYKKAVDGNMPATDKCLAVHDRIVKLHNLVKEEHRIELVEIKEIREEKSDRE